MPDPLEQLRTPVEPVAPRDEFRWVLRRRMVEALGVDPTRIPVDPADLTYIAPQEDTTMTTTTSTTVTAITPYITVHDGAAAIAFYTEAFGAIEDFRVVGDDGRVGHAELRIGAARIQLSDPYPEIDVRSPRDLGGSTFALSLTVPDCDAAFARAVAAGAHEERQPADQPHGNRMAVVRDPFGHRWNLLQPIEQFDLATYAERTEGSEFHVVSGPGESATASRDYGNRVSLDGVWAIVNYADALAAIRFAVDVLGFREHLVVQDNADPTIVHHSELHWPEGGVVQIGSLARPGDENVYSQAPGLPPYVITLDPESVLARCEAAGVEIISPMEYVPYGVDDDRGFTIRDFEGNYWAIGTYGATVR
jgi:PhnB protein